MQPEESQKTPKETEPGRTKSMGNMIYKYYDLVLLRLRSSLVERESPSDRLLGWK